VVAVAPPVAYLVDASFFIFRAYYSVPVDMADPEGQPVNALYGFARFLCDLIEREQPARIAVAFDESLASSFRNRIYPAYKAHREPAPADLKAQFVRCRELCSVLGIAHFASAEYEADDIIGTLAWRMREAGIASSIVTRDKDLSQLIRPPDEFWDYMAGDRLKYADIAPRFGVLPERMADFLALTGDAVDNIPGVPGIGKKTAGALLTKFESLEQLYDNLDGVATIGVRGAAGVVAKLSEHRAAAFLARELTRIACDMPLAVSPQSLQRTRPDLPALNAFCEAAGFGAMLRRQAERIAQAMPTL
jgi:5'-3' exonuclease